MSNIHFNQPLTFLIIGLVLIHQNNCWASQNCSCPCSVVKVSSPDKPILVWDKINPQILQTSDCTQVQFVSSNPDSHVCLQQLYNLSTIRDSNVEMIVYDGLTEALRLKYFPNTWQSRELCSTKKSLTFLLKKLNNNLEVKTEQLYINFKVVHMESVHRKLYFDDYYCDGTYRIHNSSIKLYSNSSLLDSKKVCGINILKDVSNNRNMCLYYSMNSKDQFQNSWNMYVSVVKYSMNPKDYVFSFNSSSSTEDAWCDNIPTVMLIFEKVNVSVVNQDQSLFDFFVYDFNGTKESFIDYIKQKDSCRTGLTTNPTTIPTLKESQVSLAVGSVLPIVIAIAVLLLFILLAMTIYVRYMTRYVCKFITKSTVYSNSPIEQKQKLTKSDIVVVIPQLQERGSLLDNL